MIEPANLPEPWLRGNLTEVPALQRAVLHALQAADEDLRKWCHDLTIDELQQRPSGLTSVAFHLHHIPGSIDRLLTYAEGSDISQEQWAFLKAEGETGGSTDELLERLSAALEAATERVKRFSPSELEQPRFVGRKRLRTSVGGLLVHVADHTQRHVGQAITTARVVLFARARSCPPGPSPQS